MGPRGPIRRGNLVSTAQVDSGIWALVTHDRFQVPTRTDARLHLGRTAPIGPPGWSPADTYSRQQAAATLDTRWPRPYATLTRYRTGSTTASIPVVKSQQELARSTSRPYKDGGMSELKATGIADMVATILSGRPPWMRP